MHALLMARIGYYISSGIKTPLKVYGVLEICSLLLNVGIWIRIKLFKWKSKSSGNGKSLFLADVELMSLTNFAIIFTNLTIFLMFVANQVGMLLFFAAHLTLKPHFCSPLLSAVPETDTRVTAYFQRQGT